MKKKKILCMLLTFMITTALLPLGTTADDSYTVLHNPGHIAQIPFDGFGDAGLGANEVVFQIDGQDKKSLCNLNHYNNMLEITMPWDIVTLPQGLIQPRSPLLIRQQESKRSAEK